MTYDLAIIVDPPERPGFIEFRGPAARGLDERSFKLSDDWDIGGDLFDLVARMQDTVGNLLSPYEDVAIEAFREFQYHSYVYWRRWIPHNTADVLGALRYGLDQIAKHRIPRVMLLGASVLQFPFDILPFGNYLLSSRHAPENMSDLADHLPAFAFECFQEPPALSEDRLDVRLHRGSIRIWQAVLRDLESSQAPASGGRSSWQTPVVLRCEADTKLWNRLPDYLHDEYGIEAVGPYPSSSQDSPVRHELDVAKMLVRPDRGLASRGEHLFMYVHAHGDVSDRALFEVRFGFGARWSRRRFTVTTADIEEGTRLISKSAPSSLLQRGQWSVLLNCCLSAGLGQADFGRWPEIFLDSGARSVCGSRYEIPEDVAAEFAKDLYVASNRVRPSLAILVARRLFLARSGNPMALSYVGLDDTLDVHSQTGT